MTDQSVSLNTVLAAVAWLAALVLSVLDAVHPLGVTALAVVSAVAAGTLTVRGYVRQLNQNLTSVYRLGQESERRGPRAL